MKTKHRGFGPTLAHEKLVEKEKLNLSKESVRKLMIAEKLWKARKAKKVVVHQLRERRACFGELVQIDGSPHDWFEGRAPTCVLLVFIDDATGKLLQLQFADSESFFAYAQAAEGYFRQYGKPVAFYSDKHGIFRVNQRSLGTGDAITQFGRAMQELDIQIICANTPQRKDGLSVSSKPCKIVCPRRCAYAALPAAQQAMPICLNSFRISTCVSTKNPAARSLPIAH